MINGRKDPLPERAPLLDKINQVVQGGPPMPDLRWITPGEEEEKGQGMSDFVRAVAMQVIHFFDKKAPMPDGTHGREIILLYTLGEDGIVREFTNGKWTAIPIPSEPASE